MTESREEFVSASKRLARKAGLLYFLLALSAPVGLLYVPGKILVAGDPIATAENLRRSAGLLRLGIASELVHQVLVVFLVLVLYRLFEQVSRPLARQVVVLGALLSVPIVFVNVLNDLAALSLAQRPAFLSAFTGTELDSLAYFFLRLHSLGLDIASIFWGLWLFPFALLVIRSRFLPPLLGYLMMAAGAAYLANAFATLVLPAVSPYVAPVAGVLYLGELPIIFWLLIRGARPRPERAAGEAAPG